MKKKLKCAVVLLIAMVCYQSLSAQLVVGKDTSASKPKKKPDYSHLASFPEFHTNIIGTVVSPNNPRTIQMYPKAGLFGDSSHYISHGARFEVLNESLAPMKSQERMLVRIIDNPPVNQYAGDTGWIWIGQTNLLKFLDRAKNKVDTNFLYDKYLNAGIKCRSDAAKTKCPANKKCLSAWAAYYDCMMKGARSDSPPPCPIADCVIEECGEDLK